MKRALIFTGLVLIALTLTMGPIGCGGGGGGGGAVYSVAGVWRLIASNSPQAVIGTILTLKSDGTGKITFPGTKAKLTWAQDGNALGLTVYDSSGYITATVQLTWHGPDKYSWLNQDGGSATYVRVGYARTELERGTTTGAATLDGRSAGQAAGLLR